MVELNKLIFPRQMGLTNKEVRKLQQYVLKYSEEILRSFKK